MYGYGSHRSDLSILTFHVILSQEEYGEPPYTLEWLHQNLEEDANLGTCCILFAGSEFGGQDWDFPKSGERTTIRFAVEKSNEDVYKDRLLKVFHQETQILSIDDPRSLTDAEWDYVQPGFSDD